MKTVISFCEQTHATGRGYACDDHIHKECHTTESTAEIQDLIPQVKAAADKRQEAAVSRWYENNPDAEECCCEGEEFVGLKWAEIDEYEAEPASDDTPAETVAKKLRELLAELTE